MKTYLDYHPTREEIEESFGDPDDPELANHLKLLEGTDTEKFKIAGLLVDRGEHKEALRIIETIADAEYREDMRRIVQSWINLPQGALW
ncbi:hypothetical protein Despr_1495 [Desulfobulbus propionicus DSM 2032]|uniref:Uncharacterized protein n=1 Tax=Desulfobulbus propionicus (strain ATCC 33891 / DSM 2032 / VKM B-1956 / 1pr3) TaxID=577650 RepID=A0A7U4DP38_DESPD|nr:hypothetical protein [Desulfobulbus propionicus]ADW17649.1 hypothetical protein Despr_1495 [Desulfobulbus propionicus DSM 2032]